MVQIIYTRCEVINSDSVNSTISTALHALTNTLLISIPINKDYKLNAKKVTLECNDRNKMNFVYVANEPSVNDTIYCRLGTLDATLSRFSASGFTYAKNKQVNIQSQLF
jgi:hypothetical protein